MRRRSLFSHVLVLTLLLSAAGCTHSRVPAAEDTAPRDEAIPVGYGTMEERYVTTSVGSVESDEMYPMSYARVEEMLQGHVAGVQVTRVGDDFRVRVRGMTSINGTNEPLFVVDGVPLRMAPGAGLRSINPNDVARIEVLKDAAATALYGSRGACGVILVTTKRGR